VINRDKSDDLKTLGATQGLHLTVQAGLMNEAVVVFSKPSQNERHFCFVSELESATKITLD
jgi:hypothetical protein